MPFGKRERSAHMKRPVTVEDAKGVNSLIKFLKVGRGYKSSLYALSPHNTWLPFYCFSFAQHPVTVHHLHRQPGKEEIL
jgi:hypothetical protein